VDVRPCKNYVAGREGNGRGREGIEGEGERGIRRKVEGRVKYSKTRCLTGRGEGENEASALRIIDSIIPGSIETRDHSVDRARFFFFFFFRPILSNEWGQ